jgi:3-oxoacyl-[acyl-carrier protein] reductase
VELRLDGKVALVTGAAQGIGAGIALALARAGARVAVADVDPGGDRRPEFETLRAADPEALYLGADVADEAAVAAMAAHVLEQWHGIDVLVNNAGVISQAPVVALAADEWDRVIAVNLRSVFLCCRAVLPQMLARGSGRIINVSSQLAYLGGSGTAHYSASKGGVLAFTRALAREVARDGVLVNAIAPGPTETAMQDQTPPEWRAWKEGELPLGRFATIEEVAASAVFLASDAATNYVGQTLGPNSGDVMP